MANITADLTVTVLDMPKVKRLLKRYEKMKRRRAWVNHRKHGKRG